MRNFIDIINGTNNARHSLLTSLEEGIKENLGMLGTLRNISQRYQLDTLNRYLSDLETLMRELQRNDRQVYAARWCRIWILKELLRMDKNAFWRDSSLPSDPDMSADVREKTYEQFHSEVSRLAAKYIGEWKKTMTQEPDSLQGTNYKTPMQALRREIVQHYMGIEYSKIKNYVFGNQSFADIIADLENLEEEYKARVSGNVTMHEGDKIILRLGNGYMWMMLSRGYCPEEARAMGHCGNAGAAYSDRILSLRKFEEKLDGVDYYSVYLTFILDGDGRLGEMKGRSNDKPAARYHPAIIELLKLDIIKGIKGGGYLPQNNFSLKDLTDEQQDKLLEAKPELGGMLFRFEKQGDTPELRKALIENMKEMGLNDASFDDEDNVVVKKWKDIEDMVDDLSKDETTQALAKSDDSAFDHWHFSTEHIDENTVGNLFDELSIQRQIKISLYVQGLVEENGDEDEIEEFDPTSTSDVIDKLKEYDEEHYNTFVHAISMGEQYGAESEAYETFVDAVENAAKEINIGTLVFGRYSRPDGTEGLEFDSPCYIKLSIKEACEMADDPTDEYGDTIDLSDLIPTFWPDKEDDKHGVIYAEAPYYGWSGYDQRAAIEHVIENLNIDDIDDIEQAPTPKPDFTKMPSEQVEAWINSIYEKIPDGYIRKRPLNTINQDRWPGIADGLWKNYYG